MNVMIFCAAVLLLIILSFMDLFKSSNRIYRKLDKFEEQVNATDDLEELNKIMKEFVEFSNKNCWYKHMYYRAKEIYAILKTKIKILSK